MSMLKRVAAPVPATSLLVTSLLATLLLATSLLVLAPAGGARAAGGCELPDHPTASCTGVPAGTAFAHTVSGDYTVTTADTVLSAYHITGSLIIKATGVTVTDTQVDGYVDNEATAASSYSITDSTVGTGSCDSTGLPSLNGHDITATRVLLQGHQDGVDVTGNNVSLTDSFLQPCYLPLGSDGFHSDGVQDQCSSTCSGVILTHDTVDARAIYQGVPTGNSALNLGSSADGRHVRAVTLRDDLFLGGGYTTALTWDAGAAWTVVGNAWAEGSWAYGPIDAEGTCGHQTWSGNTLVNVDASYRVTGTVSATGCVD